MSPYLSAVDPVVADAPLSITDLFDEYAAASRVRRAELRLAADPDLLAELDGFNYPAAA